MPGCARKEIVREGEIAIYHAWSRCVQRAFLCGEDPVTGKNYDYRRDQIISLLEYLAGVFAVDIGNYAILANHEHLIIRTRPDLTATWSDEEVAWRWKLAWPQWRDGRWVREPTDEEVLEVLEDAERLSVLRGNLASLSWFMARWKEPIARLANAETDRAGHFWEQRFGCRELTDEAGLLLCSIYVDLNQLRAGETGSLQGSKYSAINARLAEFHRREALQSKEVFDRNRSAEHQFELEQAEQLFKLCWLAPIEPGAPTPKQAATSAPGSSGRPAPARERCDGATNSPPAGTSNGAKKVEPTEKECDGAERDEPPQGSVPPSRTGPVPSDNPAPSVVQAPAEAAVPTNSGAHGAQGDPTYRRNGGRKAPPSKEIHERLKLTRKPRASDDPIIYMRLDDYVGVAQWAVEAWRHRRLEGKKAHPPPAPPAVLEKYAAGSDVWLSALDAFPQRFRRAVGATSSLASVLAKSGRRWLQGARWCRTVFG